MERYNPIERLRVNEAERTFLEFGWVPRSVFQSDVELDMEVETCKDVNPIGQLIGVQIKSATCYFKKNSKGDIIYRGKLLAHYMNARLV